MQRERFEMLATVDEYVGKYISNEWVRKKVLMFSDDEIAIIGKQIDAEKELEGDDEDDVDDLDL